MVARRPFTHEEIAQIGKDTDQEIARQLNRSTNQVTLKRRELKIPIYQSNRVNKQWDEASLAILGKYSDVSVARKLNRSLSSVRNKRISRKIAIAVQAPTHRTLQIGKHQWRVTRQPKRIMLDCISVGKHNPSDPLVDIFPSIQELERIFCSHIQLLSSDHKRFRAIYKFQIKWEELPLGQQTDLEIANLIHVSSRTVQENRLRLGIPAKHPYRQWKCTEIKLLGTASDTEIAKRLNRPLHAIKNMRTKRKIERFGGGRAYRPWTKAEIAILRTHTDHEVAEMLGRSINAVRITRLRHNIPHVKV